MSKSGMNSHKKHLANRRLSPQTQMMGYGYDPALSENSLKPPMFLTSTFSFSSAAAGEKYFELAYGQRQAETGEELGLIYSRINNPNLEIVEDRLALWEEADCGLTFSSGMAAIATALLAYLRPGDVVLHSGPVYGGTEHLIRNVLPAFGVQSVSFEADGSIEDIELAAERAAALGPVKVVYAETPANPTNGLVDLEACARVRDQLAAQQACAPVFMVDNTFLGPVWQRPLRHGADIVLYSVTKYIGGHSDLVAGAALGSSKALEPLRGFRTILGTVCDAHTCWLISRSLETLQLRMQAASDNAEKIASYLQAHEKVDKVHYSGFLKESDPSYAVFKRQCASAGGTFSFTVRGDKAAAFRVLDKLQIIKLAVSLGGTESLMEHPAAMTHCDVPKEVRLQLGITDNLLRISVGVEDADDLIADLEQALSHI